MFKKILDMIYPEGIKCIVCNDDIVKNNTHMLCDNCLIHLPFTKEKVCIKCGRNITGKGDYCLDCKRTKRYFTKAIAPLWYKGEVIRLIHKLKYGNARYLAKPLAFILYDKVKAEKINFDLIIPVPICDKRLKERGYNQSLLIAVELAKLCDKPLLEDVLIRTKDTDTQTNLTKKERNENLVDAFKVVDKKSIKDKTILLLDDVLTTGATANNCCIKLLGAKCKEIYVATIARTPYEPFKDVYKALNMAKELEKLTF